MAGRTSRPTCRCGAEPDARSPADAWTLDSLAREVGVSPSVFADRFTHIMGSPAMHYLSNWRLQLAAHLLEEQRLSIAQAAAQVGYESEAALIAPSRNWWAFLPAPGGAHACLRAPESRSVRSRFTPLVWLPRFWIAVCGRQVSRPASGRS
jgi:AraC-like DNA-binding protein